MGRPPALTPLQQEEVRRRLAAGESPSALADEFKVGRATIHRLSDVSNKVRKVAETLAAAHIALEELPPAHQHMAVSLAEQLRAVSASIAQAAVHGADTAQRLHALANEQVRSITKLDAEGVPSKLHMVAGLAKMANEAAAIPLGLVTKATGKGGPLDEPSEDNLPRTIELVGPDE